MTSIDGFVWREQRALKLYKIQNCVEKLRDFLFIN